MTDIAVYGFGGFGKEVKSIIENINLVEKSYKFKGFYDDAVDKFTSSIINEYLGDFNSANSIVTETLIVLAIADVRFRRFVRNKLKSNLIRFHNIIHPNLILSEDTRIDGEGIIINANSFISNNVIIGNYTILNVNCVIGHDVRIGEYVSIMPSVNVSGNVEIGDNVYIGVGATIVNNIKIGKNSFIGAGSVVLHDVPENKFVLGNPARIIKNSDLPY